MDNPVDLLPTRKLAFHLCDQYNLSREERIDLAEILLRRDVASWKDLDVHELGRIVDALLGHALVSHLIRTRTPQPADTATR